MMPTVMKTQKYAIYAALLVTGAAGFMIGRNTKADQTGKDESRRTTRHPLDPRFARLIIREHPHRLGPRIPQHLRPQVDADRRRAPRPPGRHRAR